MPHDGAIVEVVNQADQSLWTPVVGEVASRLRDYFVESRILPNRDGADLVVSEATRVLSQCTRPGSNEANRTGLVCGYVQSGKTASMTTVAALAKDNRFRLVILIAGVTTNLVTQNRDRMETQLREASPEWTWLMVTNPRFPADLAAIESLLPEWSAREYEEGDKRTLFITVMKNHAHLRNLADLLSQVNFQGHSALIFDDEADQASLNTRPNDPVASTTYRMIDNLRAQLPNHSYLQYTATPQAPLLITRIDSLSADFADLVSPGEGYTGGQSFFRGHLPLVESIPGGEIYADGQLPPEPPGSLMRAMQVFFIGVAVGRILAESRTHRSMLIHPSRATATHRTYYDWTTRIKDAWHRALLARDEPDRNDLLEEFLIAYHDLVTTCRDLPPFDEIRARLPAAINRTSISLVNSNDGREVPWQNGYSHILVGGEKLGRGYTVKGLTVTYMPRSPGGWTADTIQQRARFFGYHRRYLELCRVYLHNDVRQSYVAYVRHENDMRARLAEHRGRPLQEWRRLFYLDPRLAPTRRNVLSSPWMRVGLRDGWFAPKAPQFAPEGGGKNNELLSILDALRYEPDDRFPQHETAVVPLLELFERVLVPLSYLHEDDALGLCVVNCNLKTLLDSNPAARCRVYRMNGGTERERTLTDGLIPQFFQGRSSAGAASYPGDRAFAARDGPTLQLHTVRVVENRHRVGVFRAIGAYVPNSETLLVHD